MKLLFSPFSLCWLLHTLRGVEGVTEYPPNRGGGLDGVNGNVFLKGTPDTPKLEVRLLCSRSTSASTEVDMSISVYQKDTAFKYTDVGPEDDNFVEYGACFLIDAEEYINNNNIVKATSSASCGNSADLTKVDAVNPIDTSFATRTYRTQVSFTPTDATYPCGGFQDVDSQAVFAVTCKRDEPYDKAFDEVFVLYYDADAQECVARQLDASFNPGEPPTVLHQQKLEVTFKAFRNLDRGNVPWPDGPQSIDGAHSNNIREITTDPVSLFESIYFEICLINPYQPTDDPYNQFFQDGFGAIGIYVSKCTGTNDAAAGTAGIDPDTPVTIIEDGCGKGVDPTEMIGKSDNSNGRGFMYVKDTTDSTFDWLRTPNCFRTIATPSTSFARASAAAIAVTVYTCDIEYCMTSDDTRCFGDKTQDREGYPTCARKKRSATRNTTLDTTDFPKKVSLAIKVALPGSKEATEETCSEIIVLISMSTILSVVLFVVLMVAGLMTYNLKSLTRDDDDISSSMMGIVNKGIYH